MKVAGGHAISKLNRYQDRTISHRSHTSHTLLLTLAAVRQSTIDRRIIPGPRAFWRRLLQLIFFVPQNSICALFLVAPVVGRKLSWLPTRVLVAMV